MSALTDYLNAVGPVFGKMLLLPLTIGLLAVATSPRLRAVLYEALCCFVMGLFCFVAWLTGLRVDED